MKLTTKQLRQMIIEELNEMYKGKNRKFYAPGPVKLYGDIYKTPRETGAYALPSENPYDQLDPMVKDMMPYSDDPESLKQAYELSDTLGTTPEGSFEDFAYGAELADNPDKVVKGHADILEAEIKKLQAIVKSSAFDEMSAKEKMNLMKRIRKMEWRLINMRDLGGTEHSLDYIYSGSDYTRKP